MKDKMKGIAVFLAIAVLAGCGDGVIPTMKTYVGDDEVDKIQLPEYSPVPEKDSWGDERYATYGTNGTRVNPYDLYIKNAYRTSDDVIHIVLSGKISNGIPEGLLWNEDTTADFGAPSGHYLGRGDFRIGALGPETGGSLAIGPLDFSAEWVMAGPYTAIVLEGLVDDRIGTAVIEKNESLHLLSSEYRGRSYPESALYTNSSGKLQKKSEYTYNPNDFSLWPEPGLTDDPWRFRGASRGGYVMLISKSEKAVPYIASFDISYPDGTKKRFEVDYSDVQLREEIPLTQISFEVLTPNLVLTPPPPDYYIPDASNPDYYIMPYTIDVPLVNGVDITKENPLLLRPVYEPVDIDPRKTTTNMINDIYLTDTQTGIRLNNGDLVLTWDDKTQAIAFYIKEDTLPENIPGSVTINASLRLPFDTGTTDPPGDPNGVSLVVLKLTCAVTIMISP